MTVLSDLIEEAIRRSTELTQRSEAAAGDAAEVLESATELGTLALEQAEAVHKDMAEALEAIGHARDQVHDAADRAGGVLDDLPERADKTESAVKEMLAGVRADVAHLAELRARLVTRVDESAQQVDAEFHDLALRVQDLQARLEARLTEAEAEVKDLRHAVEEAHTDLGETRRKALEEIHEIGQRATEMADAFGDSLQAVTVMVGRNVVDVLNAAVTAHNKAQETLRTGLTSETPTAPDPSETWVTEALLPIREALEALALLPPAATDSLKTAAESIVQEAGTAMAALAAVARSLEQAAPRVSSTMGA